MLAWSFHSLRSLNSHSIEWDFFYEMDLWPLLCKTSKYQITNASICHTTLLTFLVSNWFPFCGAPSGKLVQNKRNTKGMSVVDKWLLPSVLLQHKQNHYLLLILWLFASFLFVFSHFVVCLATCLLTEAARSKLQNAESDFIHRASLWADTHPAAQPIKQLVMLQP